MPLMPQENTTPSAATCPWHTEEGAAKERMLLRALSGDKFVPVIVPRAFRNALANSGRYRHTKNRKSLDSQRIARKIRNLPTRLFLTISGLGSSGSRISQKRAGVWAPALPSPFRSTLPRLRPPWCTAPQCRTPHNDISFPVCSCVKSSFQHSTSFQRLFLQLHGLAAVIDGAVPGAGDDQLGAALLTHVSLTSLVRHVLSSLPISSMSRIQLRRVRIPPGASS